MNLSLAMIQEDYGPYVAQSVEEGLTLRLTKEDQEELPSDAVPFDNHPIDRFSDLVAWVIRNLHSDLSVEVLARRACMCPNPQTLSTALSSASSALDQVATSRIDSRHVWQRRMVHTNHRRSKRSHDANRIE